MSHEQKRLVRKTLSLFKKAGSSVKQPWYWHITLRNGEIVAQGETESNLGDVVTMLTHLFDLNEDQVTALVDEGHVRWEVQAP